MTNVGNAIQSQRANCKNCYKCLRACPVKSISFTSGQAELLPETCIYCGTCVQVCPQKAKTAMSQLDRVKELVRQGRAVVSLAPSFLGAFPLEEPMRMVGALRKLGFYQVRETAEGAALVSDAFAQVAKEGRMPVIVTTCCPTINNLVEKHYPDLIPLMAPVVTPMVAHGRLIKEQDPQAKVVFIGPCIAKMEEAADIRHDRAIDGVLTFEDLGTWFREAGIDPNACEAQPFDGADSGLARMYPTHAGILRNMRARGVEGYRLLEVNGPDNCLDLMEALRAGELRGCLIETSFCAGSCMGGPALPGHRANRFAGGLDVKQYAQNCPLPVPALETKVELHKEFLDRSHPGQQPTEEEITAILRSIGKESKMDELNCGSCGYPSCRAKAVAVFQGKAVGSMCLPYMFQSAQSMSNVVMDNTPNIIVVADGDLRICELNAAGRKLFGVSRSEAIDRYLYEFMETEEFEEVLRTHKTLPEKKISLEQYQMVGELIVLPLPRQNQVLGILRDVTAEEERARALYQFRLDTMNMAQKVIDKQMVAAQEIASLLGETTAETKSTLTHLKDMILQNGEERDGQEAPDGTSH